MSAAPVGSIRFEGVWKKFRYGEIHNRLRDFIPALATRALGRRPRGDDLWTGEFWALRDVSFQVRAGRALAIIGPNGAGKSTILKLLTGILRPTRGRCGVTGRVGALIDVAAGFHPDLTGRENVFLQGAIMGMPRSEIARKFDRIVEFSGIPWFIDTPVKRYSSGMQARLGFAIAAHLDPDVLIIDEVLAVGDAAFQRKAFDRISELVRRDIPVVVVSHQLDAVMSLCSDALLLREGRVACTGTPRECVLAYLDGQAPERPRERGDAAVRIESLRIPAAAPRSGERLACRLECTIAEGGWTEAEAVSIRVRSAQSGRIVFRTGTLRLGVSLPRAGPFVLVFDLQMNVPAGFYVIESFVWDRHLERESFVGPSRYVQVAGGDEFDGSVQFNPRVHLSAGATHVRHGATDSPWPPPSSPSS